MRTTQSIARFCLWVGLAIPVVSQALVPLEESEMEAVSGAGIAIAYENFRFGMAPTSYAEQIGSPTGAGTTLRQSDLRWYGVTISDDNTAGERAHFGNGGGVSPACTTNGTASLGCPIGGVIANFAAIDNPYVIRAFEYTAIDYQGDTVPLTVFEYLAPSRNAACPNGYCQEDYKMSFYGEIDVPSVSGLLKSQTVIRGSAAGSVFRIFKFTDDNDPTVGLFYHSYLQGDFRFSVNQLTGSTSDVSGVAPTFESTSGLHFRNVDAYIPMGQLHYQALTLDSVRDGGGAIIPDGNFVLELKQIPNQVNVYNDFYSRGPSDASGGYNTVLKAISNFTNGVSWGTGVRADPGTIPARWYVTHGYSRWGDWSPYCTGCTRNGATAIGDGIFFRSSPQSGNFTAFARRPSSINVQSGAVTWDNTGYGTGGLSRSVVNLGDARVEGLSVQSMRITTLGAGI